MRALTLIPRHWYSWDFFVTDDDRQLAEFNLSSWREKGSSRSTASTTASIVKVPSAISSWSMPDR